GDVVKVNCISYSGRVEVVSFRRVMAFVKFEDGDVREYSKSRLTLISKGPKVHTFEGVRIMRFYKGPSHSGGDRTLFYPYINIGTLEEEDLLKPFHCSETDDSDKTYTLTMKEEK
ncbi:hypothetical protein LCGC14_1581420, partial [marine sediment metagenome]